MNPAILNFLSFAGRRAGGAIISCAAIMLFKASIDAVKEHRVKNAMANLREVVDHSTGEIFYV